MFKNFSKHSHRCECITKMSHFCKNTKKFKVVYLEKNKTKTVFCCGVHLRKLCKKPVISVFIIRSKDVFIPYNSIFIKYDFTPVPDNTLITYMKGIKKICMSIVNKATNQHEDDICSICLDSLHYSFILKKHETLSCNHSFHKKCIDSWIQYKKYTCPLCREDIIMNKKL